VATNLVVPAPAASDIWFPKKFLPLFQPSRYKIAKGGRGGAKSWNIARALIMKCTDHYERILCTREVQNSIKESVHKLLSLQIDKMGLSAYWEITDKSIYCPHTGSEFIFAGLRTDPDKIKSMEGIVWVEEAHKVSERSWEVLIPTIREDGSEIWVSFNPDEEKDPTSKRFITNPPPDSIIIDVSWKDNPWLPKVLLDEKDYLYRVDPDTADHVWGGKFRRVTAAQIFRGKYIVEEFEPVAMGFPDAIWKGPFYGLDFGFSDDPLFGVKIWIHQKRLYIEHESVGKHVENNDIAPKLRRELPGVENGAIRADNSRPETISHVKKEGHLNCVPCDKWKGSVEDGIAFLRSFEKIVIHPRCEHMIDEAKYYRYKTDKLDENIILTEIVDAWNHGWDAVRYAVDKMIKHKRTMFDVV
jgi:phage terminase large subunit